MKKSITTAVVLLALLCFAGCEHINCEIDWQPLIESIINWKGENNANQSH